MNGAYLTQRQQTTHLTKSTYNRILQTWLQFHQELENFLGGKTFYLFGIKNFKSEDIKLKLENLKGDGLSRKLILIR